VIAVSSQMQHTQCLSLKTVLNVLVDSRALVILIVSQSVSGSVCLSVSAESFFKMLRLRLFLSESDATVTMFSYAVYSSWMVDPGL